MNTLLAWFHAHPIIWLVVALVVGFIVGQEYTLSQWNAERRRWRKSLGIATLDDYLHRD